ncbi:GFA family protein [Leptolyngbya cf. ectocarpi LEGE 11479]|uniref:GFA family protein n=1 Tax=Leptolyngbya cf. ectocarpi LEGE 11479 TaxID=1828722 RepID=A0A928ZZD7_LEPEC|nr:GFA family protein [Leptolyngbya ectocarpi]MBE9070242.1 GFA family protein [Leptolyngbya cf. ectocarpi LEGE 11479]
MTDLMGKGSCLCGAVHFTVNTMNTSVGACHCQMCRKWTGGPFMAIDCGIDVTFEGEDNIAAFGSSEWAERGFCKLCGSHLFYRLKQNHQYFMAAGLFDDDTKLIFDHQVFIDQKPAFYCFANKTQDMTEAEVFAQFSGA